MSQYLPPLPVRGGAKDVQADDRMVAIHWLMEAPLEALIRLLYPTLYPLHDPSEPWGTVDDNGSIKVRGGWRGRYCVGEGIMMVPKVSLTFFSAA